MAKTARSTARARATARVRELLGELKTLTAAFPDLADQFDEDELPVAILIRRDAAMARKQTAPPAGPARTGVKKR